MPLCQELGAGCPGLQLLLYPRRLVLMPGLSMVLRAFTLGPFVRLGWGAVFGRLVW